MNIEYVTTQTNTLKGRNNKLLNDKNNYEDISLFTANTTSNTSGYTQNTTNSTATIFDKIIDKIKNNSNKTNTQNTYYDDGTLKSVINYDADGNKTSSDTYFENGSLKTHCEYNTKGKLRYELSKNENGQILYEKKISSNGNVQLTSYSYDEDDKLNTVIKNVTDKNNNVIFNSHSKYLNGKISSQIIHNKNNTKTITFEYDSNGNKTKETKKVFSKYCDEEEAEIIKYYNQNGEIIKIEANQY